MVYNASHQQTYEPISGIAQMLPYLQALNWIDVIIKWKTTVWAVQGESMALSVVVPTNMRVSSKHWSFKVDTWVHWPCGWIAQLQLDRARVNYQYVRRESIFKMQGNLEKQAHARNRHVAVSFCRIFHWLHHLSPSQQTFPTTPPCSNDVGDGSGGGPLQLISCYNKL